MATHSHRKQESHDRIVAVAARAIRRRGYDGVGIGDIMGEAGLTHGGFYAHFPSKEALLAEAADKAGAEGIEHLDRAVRKAPAGQALQTLVASYLSDQHVQAVDVGCPVAALGSEMPRQAPPVRRAATHRIEELVSLVERQLSGWGTAGAHTQALAVLSMMVGALVIARAVDKPELGRAVREAVLDRLESNGP